MKKMSLKEKFFEGFIFIFLLALSGALMYLTVITYKSDLTRLVKWGIIIISGITGIGLFSLCLRMIIFIILEALDSN